MAHVMFCEIDSHLSEKCLNSAVNERW